MRDMGQIYWQKRINVTSTRAFYSKSPCTEGLGKPQMIDNLSILLSHALLAFAIWHLMNRTGP